MIYAHYGPAPGQRQGATYGRPGAGNKPPRGRSRFAGVIEERDDVFAFTYDPDHLSDPDAAPVNLTLPLRPEPYERKVFFPFFDGLIPEGWLLDLAARHWKLDPRDRMGLLLVDFGLDDIEEIAHREIRHCIAVTGAQRKISLDLAPADDGRVPRLTFVGLP